MSARYIAICELSLAATYAKHGNWRLVGVCATSAIDALRFRSDHDETASNEADILYTEAQAYMTAAQTHIGG